MGRARWNGICGLVVLALTAVLAAPAAAEQAGSDVRALQAGWLDGGMSHNCAVLSGGSLRCWGSGGAGQLGYGNRNAVGTGAPPTPTIASAGAVPVGAGRTVRAVSAGDNHTCAILDDGSVRCWGLGSSGQLGYGNRNNVGDGSGPTPTIESAGPVPLGGHTARAIAAGLNHTCAILDDGSVRCWGLGGSGQLGYGNRSAVGDGTGPAIATAGPVPLGTGHTARAIAAGQSQTCAILDDFTARCWGAGGLGQLGYGNANPVGDGTGPTPAIESAGPIFFGPGRTARSITAGSNITTCATLDDGTARCWGGSSSGQLGYGNTRTVGDGTGDTPTIVSAGPVPLGTGHTARAITAGWFSTCAMLEDGTARCWGAGGQLGYGNTNPVGSGAGPTPTIVSAGAVPLDGRLESTVSDLALTLGASPGTLVVGGQTTVNVTLTNDGPDDAPGVVVSVQLPSFAASAATPSRGSFDAGSGSWNVGTIPAGGQAALAVPARALAAGAFTALAQVSTAGAFDPDLVPASATGQLTVTAAAKDAQAPDLTLSVPRRIALATLRRRGLAVSATPNEPAAIGFQLLGRARRGRRARDVVLASKRFGLASGKRTARLVPSRRRLGRHRRPFTLRVRITARDAAGNTTVVTRRVRVTLSARTLRR